MSVLWHWPMATRAVYCLGTKVTRSSAVSANSQRTWAGQIFKWQQIFSKYISIQQSLKYRNTCVFVETLVGPMYKLALKLSRTWNSQGQLSSIRLEAQASGYALGYLSVGSTTRRGPPAIAPSMIIIIIFDSVLLCSSGCPRTHTLPPSGFR